MTEHTNTPELRFPEFNEEWREFNLKDISTKKIRKIRINYIMKHLLIQPNME